LATKSALLIRMPKWWSGFIAFPLHAMWLVGCLLQGCAASPGPPRIACGLCEEPDRFVRLQAFPSHTFEDTQRRFAHPFNLQPDEWKIILSNVHVQPIISPNYLSSQLGPVIPVFTTEDVGYLSQTLHLAFPKAQPEDVIVFALSYTGPPQSSEFTTGGWYVEGTKLHLILANYRATVSMSNIREVLDREPLFEIVGSKRFDFVTNEMAQKVSNKSSFLASVLTSETPHLAIEYNMMLGVFECVTGKGLQTNEAVWLLTQATGDSWGAGGRGAALK